MPVLHCYSTIRDGPGGCFPLARVTRGRLVIPTGWAPVSIEWNGSQRADAIPAECCTGLIPAALNRLDSAPPALEGDLATPVMAEFDHFAFEIQPPVLPHPFDAHPAGEPGPTFKTTLQGNRFALRLRGRSCRQDAWSNEQGQHRGGEEGAHGDQPDEPLHGGSYLGVGRRRAAKI
jgi:hypothetical protein